jgi:ribonuclease D
MANFCGFGFNAGYSKLVKRILNIRIDKDLQNSEWRIRPLTYSQLKYAISDVIYLEEIYNSFIKTINPKRLAWYEEEMNRFIGKLSYQGIENLSRNFSFIKKNDIQISQTKKLIMLRENISKRINVPRQRFLKDIHIEFIVEYKEITNDIINKNNIKYIDDIREIINSHEVIKTEYVDLSMSSEQKNIFLQAKKFINKISFQENFQEQFLISNLDLKKIICEKELFGKIVSGWRYQVFGNDLEKIINKKNYENVYC